MTRVIYTLVLYLALPIVALRLLWRAKLAPAYAQRWGERFALAGHKPSAKSIWVHAVSVGETLAALDMIRALQARYPEHRLLVTTTTPTGSERVRQSLGASVDHVYLPYDLPDVWWRFFRQFRPALLIVMETELWPNLLAACAKRGIPTLLANARLSEKSAKGYARMAWLAQPMLRRLTAIAAQQQADADRFLALGLPPAALVITGNIKFDLTLTQMQRDSANALHAAWAPERQQLWLAASTHAGEDEQLLAAFRQARQQLPTLRLLLVPRHPERFAQVAAMSEAEGWRTARRSAGAAAEFDVLIGDTMGELQIFYGACDLAFVGGSLVPRGGHNMIEPAAWAKPIISGPHVFNFAEVARLLEAAGAMMVVKDADSLAAAVVQVLTDPALNKQQGQAALSVANANRGALETLLHAIDRLLA
ncbi:lipid IV(A) 3-deoxy-D-manno-octulosonic acid transferase [Simiduia curdlanivorans]|uniref:3-deoxy-D-manno-octulosonic acid transferase n=1 Tax=Simiduia curdlanivorans TaxID=1492769 RepID=A0ABV8V263_9GAMM|nr:lipid IV(A) 3-deoxy-D-manno-octulosonic acid transferase [Simiduia curdlanivorans]MDN3637761.1 lipid IV(A) 3-deoxy-D-manno-octulosonic acid transferase [Simiduia curdlanivorans]